MCLVSAFRPRALITFKPWIRQFADDRVDSPDHDNEGIASLPILALSDPHGTELPSIRTLRFLDRLGTA